MISYDYPMIFYDFPMTPNHAPVRAASLKRQASNAEAQPRTLRLPKGAWLLKRGIRKFGPLISR